MSSPLKLSKSQKDSLPQEEYKFISDIPLYEAYYQLEMEEITKKAEAKLKKAEAKAGKAEAKAGKAEVKAEKAEQTLLKGIENLLKRGDTIESIADLLMRSVEDVTALVAQIDAKK